MKSNVWEEQTMSNKISSFHEEILLKTNLPKWMENIICPFCKKELPLRSIRSISLCLNTRNYGDLSVEVLCDDCSQMDTIYYRENINKIEDFIDLLINSSPQTNPIIEEKMYKLQYNNIVNKMANQNKQKESHNDNL